MPEKLPVVAVITNYNMAGSLNKLLKQVCQAGYDDIYVLDDHSTDESVKVAESYNSARVIRGEENLGPAGNRNRIISALGQESILHFLDADVSLISKNNPDRCRQFFKDDSLGLVGGLITLPDGKPWMFNYGPAYSLYSIIGGSFHTLAYGYKNQHPLVAKTTSWFTKDFADPTKKPEAKDVYWVGEANMIIPSQILKEVGGFDGALRFHEAQDLAIKLHRKGYRVHFSPEVSVQHPFIKIPMSQAKREAMNKADRYLKRKHGFHFKNVS